MKLMSSLKKLDVKSVADKITTVLVSTIFISFILVFAIFSFDYSPEILKEKKDLHELKRSNVCNSDKTLTICMVYDDRKA